MFSIFSSASYFYYVGTSKSCKLAVSSFIETSYSQIFNAKETPSAVFRIQIQLDLHTVCLLDPDPYSKVLESVVALVVTCEEDLQLQRVMEQRHLSERESKLMIAAQMSLDQKGQDRRKYLRPPPPPFAALPEYILRI
jgi:hypothetical protein